MTHQLQLYLRQEQINFPASIHLTAIFFFSLTGALAAMRRGYDFVGVFLLALVVSAGGGLIRDGLFLQQGPPVLTQDWRYLPFVVVACLVAWITNHWIVRFGRVIAVLDAVGLSVYSMIGLLKSIEADLSVPAAILVGIVNAAGGGLLRDILTHEEPLLFRPGQFYVLASLVGCCSFVTLGYLGAVKPIHATEWSMAVIFVLRMFAIIFNWRTIPMKPLTSDSNTNPPSL